MNKAKRYRKHYHYTVHFRDTDGHIYWSTCDGPTHPTACKKWYKFYFRNTLFK